MISSTLALGLSLLLPFTTVAWAGTADPLTGTRISLRGLQAVLAAPPLPSLEREARGGITVQASYIHASVDDDLPLDPASGISNLHTSGKFNGGGVGLGITGEQDKAVTLFGFAAYNNINGNLRADAGPNTNATDFTDVKNSGFALVGGIAKRFATSGSSPLAFGLFIGPAILHFSSELTVSDVGTISSGGRYTASPWSYGGIAGVQVGIQISELYLNPYALYYGDITSGCKEFTPPYAISIPPGTGSSDCESGNFVKMHLDFGAYGINIGLRNFFFNVYSKVINDSSLEAIRLHNYQLVYATKF